MKIKVIKNFSFAIITVFVLSFNLSQVEANTASGWISPKAIYIEPQTTCADPSNASIEFVLVEHGTTNQITSSIGSWVVRVRDSSLSIKQSINFNGVKSSSKICFDPTTDGLQVLVNNSPNYYKFTGPTILPKSSSDFSSMRGSHFRGYVELLSTSVTTEDIEMTSPLGGSAYSTFPSLTFTNNRLSSLFNSTELKLIKFYISNQSSGALYTAEIPATGGAGPRIINNFSTTTLPQGIYFWTFHQEENGYSDTNETSGIKTWNFTDLPVSAAPSAGSFMIDNQPLSTNQFHYVLMTSVPVASSTSIRYVQKLKDDLSGIDSVTTYVMDSLNNIILISPEQIKPSADLYGTTAFTYAFTNFTGTLGTTYKFYAVAKDVAGNTSTSSITTYTVPTVYGVPILSAPSVDSITSSSSRTTATVLSEDGFRYSSRGVCWSAETADLTTTGGTCKTTVAYNPTPYTFNEYPNGMPSNTTIYYRAFATSVAGTGYSSIGSFNTLGEAFSTTSSSTIPTVVGETPTGIYSSSAYVGSNITSTGGSLITARGMCWDTSLASLNAQNVATSTKCVTQGSLPLAATLPFRSQFSLDGLPANTLIYYRAFATNANGTAYSNSTFTTDIQRNDFVVNTIIPTQTYIQATDSYNLDLNFIMKDKSNYQVLSLGIPQPKMVPYEIKLDFGNNGTYERTATGSIGTAAWLGSTPIEYVSFSNLPGGFVRIVLEVNKPESTYPELAANRINNSTSTTIILSQTGSEIDESLSAAGGGSSALIPVDPGMLIWAGTGIVRSGQQTTVSWDTVAAYDMSCTIYGPSDFVRTTFNPSVDGTTGTISSGTINSAQNYLLECTEPLTGTKFTSSVRVKVAGVVQEI